MARQGYRVWFARLAILSTVSLIVLTAIGFAIWKQATTAPDQAQAAMNKKLHPSDKPASVDTTHPLTEVLALARKALKQHQMRDTGYTARMIKHERVGGKLQPESTMDIKLRYREGLLDEETAGKSERNTDVYLRFTEPKAQAGREAIWKQGQNDNKLTVHETGMFNLARVEIAPRSTLAMVGNRYPISDIGIERLITKLIEKGERDRDLGDCIVRRSESTIDNRPCDLIEVIHPYRTAQVDGREIVHEFFIAEIYIDKELFLPVKYASFNWPEKPDGEPELDEEYTFLDIKLNVPLEDVDFDPNNPDYHYPW